MDHEFDCHDGHQINELPGTCSPGLFFTTPSIDHFPANPDANTSSDLNNSSKFRFWTYILENPFVHLLKLPFTLIKNTFLICPRCSNMPTQTFKPQMMGIGIPSISTNPSASSSSSNQVKLTQVDGNSKRRFNAISQQSRTLNPVPIYKQSNSTSHQNTNSNISPCVNTNMIIVNNSNSSSVTSRKSYRWYRFSDHQLACLLLVLFGLATLLVAMGLQYILIVQFKVSSDGTNPRSGDESDFTDEHTNNI